MSDPLSQSLAALSRFFVGDRTVEDTLQRVAELSAVAVPPAAMTGITMMVEGKPATSVFTDPTSPEIDQAQYDADTGPCLDTFRERRLIAVGSTEGDRRWPAFAAAAVAHGIKSTLSAPMVVSDDGVGALNLYAREEHAFTSEHAEAAMAFAEHAAIVLANAMAYWDAYLLSENLNEAMKSRAVIEQAKGVIMAQSRVDADTAFDILRRASQRSNRKLRDVAADVVARFSAPQDPGGPRPAEPAPDA